MKESLVRYVISLKGLVCLAVLIGASKECMLLSVDAADQRMVFMSDAPLRTVHQLQFSSDSSRLYAAGVDKRVFGWNLFRDPGGNVGQITPVASSWWPVSRSHRGNIYAMAVTSEGPERIVISGYSAFGAGDVSFINPADRSTLLTLPTSWNDRFDNGHATHVTALDINKSGTAVVSVASDGEVRYWQKARGWASTILHRGNPSSDVAGSCRFQRDGSVLFSRVVSGRDQIVHVTTPATHPRLSIPVEFSDSRIESLASSSTSDRWVSCNTNGMVYCWNGEKHSGQFRVTKRDEETKRVAVSAMFGRGSLLLLNTRSRLKDSTKIVTRLETWNIDEGENRKLDSVIVGTGSREGLAAAISPDGRLAAGVDDDRNAIVLFHLDAEGRFSRDDQQQARRRTMRSASDAISHVRFSTDALRLQIGTPDEGARVFDLQNGTIDPQQARNIVRVRTPWKVTVSEVETDPERGRAFQKLMITGRKEAEYVRLDTSSHGLYSTHSWLPVRSEGVPLLAVGTGNGNLLVFRFAGAKLPWQLVRYYRDHSDRISSLSVSHDGRFLASGSSDATVKVWSLAALNRQDARFDHHSVWGGSFEIINGRVVVSQLEPAGIAAARGLQAGDLVTEIEWGGSNDARNVSPRIEQHPARILAAIRSSTLSDQVRFTIQRNGLVLQSPRTAPGWEPLVTIFMDRRNEWAMATPRGFYDASANGDRLFGWIVNPEQRTGTPQFYEGKQFRKDFERPKALRELFAAGNLSEALERAGIDAAGQTTIAATVKEFPDVQITAPANTVARSIKPNVTIQARVRLPGNRENYEVKAWLNGAPLDRADSARQIESHDWQFEWDTEAFDPRNRILVRAQRTDEPFQKVHDEAESNFAASVDEAPRRVFFAGIAVGTAYPDADATQGESMRLRYTVNDVNAISRAICQAESPDYLLGAEPEILLEKQVSRENVQTLCASILAGVADASPRDLLIVCLSGHGVIVDSEYYFVPAFDGLKNFAKGGGEADDTIKDRGVSWSQLSVLARAPCRKLFLIDTCHAGEAAAASVRGKERKSKVLVRSANALDCLVFAAAAPDENAYEDDAARHGFFTKCWLEAIEGNADGFLESGAVGDVDQSVDLLETIWYVENTVPRRHPFQHPGHSPARLAAFVNMPLRNNVRLPGK